MASSQITAISNAVKALVVSATEWEKVYLGGRIRLDAKTYIDDFKDSNDLYRGAVVGWGAFEEDRLTNWETEADHEVVVRCYYGALDDSEFTFRVQLEKIQQAIRDAPLSSLWDVLSPIKFGEPRLMVYGHVLCHYAELKLHVTERIVVNRTTPTWTEIIIWHRFLALVGAPGGGVFNFFVDATFDGDVTAGNATFKYPSWQSYAEFSAGMMPDPDADDSDDLLRTGRLWVDGEVLPPQPSVWLTGLKDVNGIPLVDVNTQIAHVADLTDTNWTQTTYTPANLAGSQVLASPPDIDGGAS